MPPTSTSKRSKAARWSGSGSTASCAKLLEPPRALHAALVSRVKVMAELDIAEKRLPQDGRITLRIAGRPVDVRVSHAADGPRRARRAAAPRQAGGRARFHELGMSDDTRDRMDELVRQAHGIVLVTGPTGSGKTTTLYAALSPTQCGSPQHHDGRRPDRVRPRRHRPDPGQRRHRLTFARALRAILRQDPDVVMVGEIRDLETARIAMQASLTGHLVLATLHTNDAVGAVTRLIDMGIEPFLLSSTLLGVMAQRLVRRPVPGVPDHGARECVAARGAALRTCAITRFITAWAALRARGRATAVAPESTSCSWSIVNARSSSAAAPRSNCCVTTMRGMAPSACARTACAGSRRARPRSTRCCASRVPRVEAEA